MQTRALLLLLFLKVKNETVIQVPNENPSFVSVPATWVRINYAKLCNEGHLIFFLIRWAVLNTVWFRLLWYVTMKCPTKLKDTNRRIQKLCIHSLKVQHTQFRQFSGYRLLPPNAFIRILYQDRRKTLVDHTVIDDHWMYCGNVDYSLS